MAALEFEPGVHAVGEGFRLLGIELQLLAERGEFRGEVVELNRRRLQTLAERSAGRVQRRQLARRLQQRREARLHAAMGGFQRDRAGAEIEGAGAQRDLAPDGSVTHDEKQLAIQAGHAGVVAAIPLVLCLVGQPFLHASSQAEHQREKAGMGLH